MRLDLLPLIGSLLIYPVNEILKKNKFTALKLGNILRKQNHHLVWAQFHYYLYLRLHVDARGLAWAQLWEGFSGSLEFKFGR